MKVHSFYVYLLQLYLWFVYLFSYIYKLNFTITIWYL